STMVTQICMSRITVAWLLLKMVVLGRRGAVGGGSSSRADRAACTLFSIIPLFLRSWLLVLVVLAEMEFRFEFPAVYVYRHLFSIPRFLDLSVDLDLNPLHSNLFWVSLYAIAWKYVGFTRSSFLHLLSFVRYSVLAFGIYMGVRIWWQTVCLAVVDLAKQAVGMGKQVLEVVKAQDINGFKLKVGEGWKFEGIRKSGF